MQLLENWDQMQSHIHHSSSQLFDSYELFMKLQSLPISLKRACTLVVVIAIICCIAKRWDRHRKQMPKSCPWLKSSFEAICSGLFVDQPWTGTTVLLNTNFTDNKSLRSFLWRLECLQELYFDYCSEKWICPIPKLKIISWKSCLSHLC